MWSRYVAQYKDTHASKKEAPKTEIPKFKWAQTKTKLTITVAIPDVKDQKVDFGPAGDSGTVSVTGTSGRNDKPYELKLDLFKAIKKGSFTADKNSVYLTIKKKKKESYWTRLTKIKPTGALKRAMEVDWANWIDEEDLSDDDDEVDEDDVKVLDGGNFDNWVVSQKVALVEFYAPWCGHCKSLKPEYAKAATELAERGSPAKLAKVDATKESALGKRFGVTGYPTLKLFRGKLTALDYKGGRTKDTIVEYMVKQTTPSVKKLKDADEVKSFVAEHSTAVVGFFDSYNDSKFSKLTEAADGLRDEYTFGAVEGASTYAGAEGTDQVVLFKPTDEKHVGYDPKEALTEKALAHWLALNALPKVGDLSKDPSLEQKYNKRKLPTVFIFLDAKDKAKETILAAAKETAQAMHGKYSVVTMAVDSKDRRQSLGIADKKIPDPSVSQPDDWSEEDDGPWEAPEIDDPSCRVAIDEFGGKVHYAMPEGEVTLETLSAFVKEHEACGKGECKLKKSVKSEPVPEKNDGPVKVAVGSTFDEVVMDDSKDVLIEFYAPWCGHCKQLTPIYEELGTKVAKSSNLVVAKLDATANDIPNSQFDVSGFPTIYFKAAGKAPKTYDGGRTVSDFVDYLKKEATHEVIDK